MLGKLVYLVNCDTLDEHSGKHYSDLTDGEFIEESLRQQREFNLVKQWGIPIEEFVWMFNQGDINSNTDVIRLL